MRFNGSSTLDDFRLQLTNGQPNEAGSAFYATPVPIREFTTDFTFQLSNPVGDGITFTIQGNGPTALGANARDLGYGGIPDSVAIEFSLYSNSIGLAIGGSNPAFFTVSLANTGINLASGDYMNVHITYDSQVLNLTIIDAVTLVSWSHAFTINIAYHLGGSSTGYVGFTGGTGSATASQKLTSWTYIAGIPAVPNFPAGFDSKGLVLNGKAFLSGATLVLTDGEPGAGSSGYYRVPIDVDSFATDFDFTIKPGDTSELADGFTFIIQNNNLNALGIYGGGLGSEGILQSVAIKFDIFNNAGEGDDSTGTYINGATPEVPAINLAPTGVVLESGDKIHAHITYDGTTLTWTLTDTTLSSAPSSTNSMTINIPAIMGSNTGYCGFTGAGGKYAAVQTILDWTVMPQQ